MPTIAILPLLACLASAPGADLDPVFLPASGAGGALVGGLAGSGLALALALAAEGATDEDVTAGAQTLNRLATFGTLVAPALLSVGGAVVGAGLAGGLVGALTVGFGATMGAAVGTGVALVTVPLGAAAVDAPGGALGATAAIAGVVVGASAVGAAVAGLLAALTLESGEPAELEEDDVSHNFALDEKSDRP